MATDTSRMIFVNLPIKDLDRSVRFFTKLGFAFDPRFTDEQATCMIVSDMGAHLDGSGRDRAVEARDVGATYDSSRAGRPKSGKTVSVSRKNVSSTIRPSEISSTWSAHGS